MDKITLKEVVDNFTWQLTDYDRPDKSLVNIPVKHMRMLIKEVKSMPCGECLGKKRRLIIITAETFGLDDSICETCQGSARKHRID